MGLKHLREQNKDFNINIVDLISKLDPTKTNKLTPFLISILKSRLGQSSEHYFGGNQSYLKDVIDGIDSELHKTLLYFMVDYYFGIDNVSQLNKFADYLERGLIENNDILKYKNFNQIEIEVSKAYTKELLKKTKKEVLTVYEDDEWWMFKPLTHDTSVVYGYGTKWCTSMKNEPEYFYRHSNGILIYVFNKKNNRKFGCHRHFGEPVRIYDEPDQQIDSFETGMSTEVLKELFKLMNEIRPNYILFSEDEKNKRDEIIGPRKGKLVAMPVTNYENGPEPMTEPYDGEVPIDDVLMNTSGHFRVVRDGEITNEVVRQMIRDTINSNNLTDDLP